MLEHCLHPQQTGCLPVPHGHWVKTCTGSLDVCSGVLLYLDQFLIFQFSFELLGDFWQIRYKSQHIAQVRGISQALAPVLEASSHIKAVCGSPLWPGQRQTESGALVKSEINNDVSTLSSLYISSTNKIKYFWDAVRPIFITELAQHLFF